MEDFLKRLRSTRSIERAPGSGRCEPRHRRLSACVDAEGILSITYDCYSQNNNVKMATVNVIIGDDFFCSLLL